MPLSHSAPVKKKLLLYFLVKFENCTVKTNTGTLVAVGAS